MVCMPASSSASSFLRCGRLLHPVMHDCSFFRHNTTCSQSVLHRGMHAAFWPSALALQLASVAGRTGRHRPADTTRHCDDHNHDHDHAAARRLPCPHTFGTGVLRASCFNRDCIRPLTAWWRRRRRGRVTPTRRPTASPLHRTLHTARGHRHRASVSVSASHRHHALSLSGPCPFRGAASSVEAAACDAPRPGTTRHAPGPACLAPTGDGQVTGDG